MLNTCFTQNVKQHIFDYIRKNNTLNIIVIHYFVAFKRKTTQKNDIFCVVLFYFIYELLLGNANVDPVFSADDNQRSEIVFVFVKKRAWSGPNICPSPKREPLKPAKL